VLWRDTCKDVPWWTSGKMRSGDLRRFQTRS
jgi:hypothetical protein